MKYLMLLGIFCLSAMLSAADWTQWRGSDRNGVHVGSEKLLDAWPEGGPKLLWKSEVEIPNGRQGGCGSVTVADGRAFLYAHYNAPTKKMSITTEELKVWGWAEGVPDSLLEPMKKADGEFGKKFWGRKAKPEEAEAFVNEFLKSLKPEEAEKYGDIFRNYFKIRVVSWRGLRDLATVRDQEFESFEELNKNIKYIGWGNIFNGHNRDASPVKGLILEKCFAWTDRVFCFDANTGKELWHKDFQGEAANKGTYYYAGSCTPTVSGDKCIVSTTGGTYCFSVKDGSILWQAKTAYTNTSPLVIDDRVIILAAEMMAIDMKTGKTLWKQEMKKQGRSFNASPILWTHANKHYVIAVNHHDLLCIDAANGDQKWRVNFGRGSNDSTPVLVGDTLVARGYAGMNVYKLGLEKPELLWTASKAAKAKAGDRGSTPVVFEGHIYITGSMYGMKSAACFDLESGALKWKESFPKLESTSPIIADGKVFAHVSDPDKKSKKRITIMYKATGDKFEKLGQLNDATADFSSPTVANGKLYLRLANHVACYDISAN